MNTPFTELKNSAFEEKRIRLFIKREDLNHQEISGNKLWKLRYNIEEAIRLGNNKLLTFGGAYSNHIYATASAAKEAGLESIGVVRGEETLPLNSTLSFARDKGMHLHYVSRTAYKEKTDDQFIQTLIKEFGKFYLIPEGGTNDFAIKGCAEFAKHLLADNEFDYVCLPVGTGGTIAGMIVGLDGKNEVLGVSVLKDGNFLKRKIDELIENYSDRKFTNWSLLTSYDHGGYAKTTPQLTKFISEMREQYNIPLDHVYTGKLVWAVMEEIKKGRFKKNSSILILHTGGLQGVN
ncbi:MAG: 1-aminocyclopropane-1-carboxylate deaminase/D-cysteine desulfhydrase [Cyclobacteriaceae bacterium]|nr:1-aminocyclopropane-1-carboxylate deaminase/D-cysteine desulfhydrase [Cyclobacteriaceae bacterium]